MRKNIAGILIIITFFSSVISVNATTITFEEVANNLKNNDFNSSLEAFQEIKNSSTISITNNKIEIITNISEDSLIASGNTTTIFNYNNGLITFKFTGDKSNSEEIMKNFISTMWITQLIYVVGELRGFSESDITEFLSNFEEPTDIKFDDYGLSMTSAPYSFEQENGNASGQYVDTFTIDINNFRLSKSSSNITNNNTQINNSNNNEIQSPETGNIIPYAIISLGLILSIIIYFYSKRKNKVHKI